MSVRRGVSLVELVVAVLLLNVVTMASLSAMLAVERMSRDTTARSRVDAERWQAWHNSERAPACVSGPPAAASLVLPATPGRAPLALTLRCGR
ncbi:MAG: hypothetical protein ABIR59_09160 [Gemmatimonadales bacterium]